MVTATQVQAALVWSWGRALSLSALLSRFYNSQISVLQGPASSAFQNLGKSVTLDPETIHLGFSVSGF